MPKVAEPPEQAEPLLYQRVFSDQGSYEQAVSGLTAPTRLTRSTNGAARQSVLLSRAATSHCMLTETLMTEAPDEAAPKPIRVLVVDDVASNVRVTSSSACPPGCLLRLTLRLGHAWTREWILLVCVTNAPLLSASLSPLWQVRLLQRSLERGAEGVHVETGAALRNPCSRQPIQTFPQAGGFWRGIKKTERLLRHLRPCHASVPAGADGDDALKRIIDLRETFDVILMDENSAFPTGQGWFASVCRFGTS